MADEGAAPAPPPILMVGGGGSRACPICGSTAPPKTSYEVNTTGMIWALVCLLVFFWMLGFLVTIYICCTHNSDSCHDPKQRCSGCNKPMPDQVVVVRA